MGSASSGVHATGGHPAFLVIDERIPPALRELLQEADGCVTNGFLTGGTACAQRAVHVLLKIEKIDGATHEARLRALIEKHTSASQMLVTILLQFGDAGARDAVRLAPNTLQLLVVALKAIAHEIYVIGPERNERLQYVRRLLESSERRASAVQEPAAAAAGSPAAPRPRTPPAGTADMASPAPASAA